MAIYTLLYPLKCPLDERYLNENLQGALANPSKSQSGPVVSSVNTGTTSYKSELGCMWLPFTYCTKLLFQPHLPCSVTWAPDISLFHILLCLPNPNHDLAFHFGGNPSSISRWSLLFTLEAQGWVHPLNILE